MVELFCLLSQLLSDLFGINSEMLLVYTVIRRITLISPIAYREIDNENISYFFTF